MFVVKAVALHGLLHATSHAPLSCNALHILRLTMY